MDYNPARAGITVLLPHQYLFSFIFPVHSADLTSCCCCDRSVHSSSPPCCMQQALLPWILLCCNVVPGCWLSMLLHLCPPLTSLYHAISLPVVMLFSSCLCRSSSSRIYTPLDLTLPLPYPSITHSISNMHE